MSRYPAMRSYDRSLLATAPPVSRQDRQAGYDVSALEQGEYYARNVAERSRLPPPPPAPPVNPFADQQQQQAYSPAASPEPVEADQRSTTKQPWYKTKKGRIWLCLGIIIFIGLIAGIAAGTAAAKQSRNTTLLVNSPQDQDSASTNPNQNSDSSNPTTQLVVPISSSSSPSIPTTPLGQEPATLTFGDSTPTPTSRGSGSGSNGNTGNQGVTIIFGGSPSPDPAVSTPGSSSGDGDVSDPYGDIPPGCWLIPSSPQCAPYFDDVPKA